MRIDLFHVSIKNNSVRREREFVNLLVATQIQAMDCGIGIRLDHRRDAREPVFFKTHLDQLHLQMVVLAERFLGRGIQQIKRGKIFLHLVLGRERDRDEDADLVLHDKHAVVKNFVDLHLEAVFDTGEVQEGADMDHEKHVGHHAHDFLVQDALNGLDFQDVPVLLEALVLVLFTDCLQQVVPVVGIKMLRGQAEPQGNITERRVFLDGHGCLSWLHNVFHTHSVFHRSNIFSFLKKCTVN